MLHVATVLALTWLSILFGRSLRADETPLIERIARVSDPALPPALCRYARRLTIIWSGYFVAAALLSCAAILPDGIASALVSMGTMVLFVGERWLRPKLFPGFAFPGLAQQLRDTWSIFRTSH